MFNPAQDSENIQSKCQYKLELLTLKVLNTIAVDNILVFSIVRENKD